MKFSDSMVKKWDFFGISNVVSSLSFWNSCRIILIWRWIRLSTLKLELALLFHNFWNSLKKPHFTTLRAKRATFLAQKFKCYTYRSSSLHSSSYLSAKVTPLTIDRWATSSSQKNSLSISIRRLQERWRQKKKSPLPWGDFFGHVT